MHDFYRMSAKQVYSKYRELWHNYHSEVFFCIILMLCVGVSTWLSRFIPDALFDHVLTPMMNVATFTVAFMGAWVVYRHSEGMLMRRLWGHALIIWGLGDLLYLVCWIVAPEKVLNIGAEHLTTYELLFGNILGWVMVLYPTEALRPGWLNGRIVAWQLLPILALVILDYILPINLRPVVALYPYALLGLVLTHIRAYRIWCEQNYSSMDNIDVQWIIRYCIMLFIVGANYVYLCSTHGHARGFTQEWFVVFMLAYSTEQILFHKDPWAGVGAENADNEAEETDDAPSPVNDHTPDNTYVRTLEQWMEKDKPYLNPDFKLMDMRAVLPMNRTYLSQFINDTYNCSFYQFVTRYRVEEAKRIMQENPEMKMADVAVRSGFSSRVVFSQIFSKETGMSPREWNKITNT